MYGERIQRLRKGAGLSQQALGERLGITSVAVSKWERGQSQPDIPTLTRLADLFGVTLDELCGRASVPPAADENLTVLTRAFGRLTRQEQEQLLKVSRALYAHAFEGEDRP